eukprot:Protomagalhaensia_wolfi_Nauph_80__4006@NODE_4066_length_647_cov_5_383224_g3223_i0_p2_GENE_NODE_4066_length_647_cov_5_383224_g3223_i0NODE_4066_length_647_cov_5_383224_g3223_i0_p2_ORF_typecomplete_len105_score8_92ATP12/PF07542_11/0_093_NODE_4066_length_647_cov_5_383224_g3223_i0247561
MTVFFPQNQRLVEGLLGEGKQKGLLFASLNQPWQSGASWPVPKNSLLLLRLRQPRLPTRRNSVTDASASGRLPQPFQLPLPPLAFCVANNWDHQSQMDNNSQQM